ncbi:DUF423 domain-containing protein [Marinomonas algarum]|uniref:DUF423 domain-containing protein n=1 Tax=Marinomonas algarum TaxID=2883105 RepID=A0A9X1INX7_9GAMM|nr:DUF423 domain-containing protein [Marinomonas algarum]MCB5161243.1 DUF423 domain-containing protein [Marinomonas algarum]
MSDSNTIVSSFRSKWGTAFALQAALSVAAGAFGAHGLKAILDTQALEWWQTGSQYLMYHALAGLIAVGLSAFLPRLQWVLVFFSLGNLLFAGSLYTMALTGYTLLGAVTPLGGVCYLSAWCLLALKCWRYTPE